MKYIVQTWFTDEEDFEWKRLIKEGKELPSSVAALLIGRGKEQFIATKEKEL